MKPTGAPSCPIIAYQPRRLGGAESASSDGRPSHEPPSATPWPMRKSASSDDRHVAEAPYPGRNAIPAVERAEHEQRERELGAAPPSALNVHEHDRPDRPGDEREREDGERPQRSVEPRFEREEDERKHQHRGDAVDEVVEVLGCPADDHADRDVAGATPTDRRDGACAARGRGRGAGFLTDAGDHVASRSGVGRCASGARRRRHGMFLICSGDGSVMLVFRWYITHSEPHSVMTTSTSVKISDIHVQPPSAFDVMCRKNTMCT